LSCVSAVGSSILVCFFFFFFYRDIFILILQFSKYRYKQVKKALDCVRLFGYQEQKLNTGKPVLIVGNTAMSSERLCWICSSPWCAATTDWGTCAASRTSRVSLRIASSSVGGISSISFRAVKVCVHSWICLIQEIAVMRSSSILGGATAWGGMRA